MKTLSVALAGHVAQDDTTLTLCWRVLRNDGTLILGTESDQDVEIDAGPLAGFYMAGAGITGSTIHSSSDLAVDNLEVTGALAQPGDLVLLDLSAADIEAGLFDDASVTLFMVNAEAPNDGSVKERVGNLGQISHTTEGQYKTELRGLSQRLRQNMIRTYDVTCPYDLGDSNCRFSLSGVIASGTVDLVLDRSYFNSTITGVASGIDSFAGGLLTWIIGNNAGLSMEVKQDRIGAVLGNLQVYEPMPYDIQVGDTFSLKPACDKTLVTCRDRFDNLLNFGGWGAYVPGRNKTALFGET